MSQLDPTHCPCCNNPWLQCPGARKVALDGRLSSTYPTTRLVEVGNDQAHSMPMNFRVIKGKR